jgi:hypothetical protein
MNLDIRLPIGLMFSLFGWILIAFGLMSSPESYQRSLNINVNLWWGAVMAIFGAAMLFLARQGRQSPPEEEKKNQPGTKRSP